MALSLLRALYVLREAQVYAVAVSLSLSFPLVHSLSPSLSLCPDFFPLLFLGRPVPANATTIYPLPRLPFTDAIALVEPLPLSLSLSLYF